MAGPFSRPSRITGRIRVWCPDAKACWRGQVSLW